MSGTIQVTKGLALDKKRQVRDVTGTAFTSATTPFDGTEALAVKVWPGDELASVATPAASWVDYTTGTYQISFAAADTAGLGLGLYRFEATATRAAKTGRIDGGRVQVVAAPGNGTAPLAFCSPGDVLTYCPWAEDLQADAGQFAFTTERSRATFRLVDDLVNQWDTAGLSPQAGQPGWDAVSVGWGSLARSPSKWLRDQIVPVPVGGPVPAAYPNRTVTGANLYDAAVSTALLLTPTVKEMVAKRALSYVFRAQVGRDDSRPWQGLAARFAAEATALYRQTRFEIDLSNPQQGWASITIAGGWGSLR